MFSVDYDKLVEDLLPVKLRKDYMLAWLRIFTQPVQDMYDNLVNFRATKNAELSYNCQTVQLERALNDYLGINYSLSTRDADIVSGSIVWIDNTANNIPMTFIYRDQDPEPDKTIYRDADNETNLIVYRTLDYSNFYHFIVNIPVATIFSSVEIQKLVNNYKKASRKYKIQTY